MKQLKSLLILLLAVSVVSITSCSKDKNDNITTEFGIFRVTKDREIVQMHGEVTDKSLNNFNALIKAFPTVKRIEIKECAGSNDDETNLKLSMKVHNLGINIHLLDNGMIASGGTDFFLAGAKRSIGANTKIGVHSWAGELDGGKKVVATDFPKGHEYHLPYIKYYKNIGFTQEQAEAFYYFTINSAPASGVHWMTKEEIAKYAILKE